MLRVTLECVNLKTLTDLLNNVGCGGLTVLASEGGRAPVLLKDSPSGFQRVSFWI